jgi:hypothetical protein
MQIHRFTHQHSISHHVAYAALQDFVVKKADKSQTPLPMPLGATVSDAQEWDAEPLKSTAYNLTHCFTYTEVLYQKGLSKYPLYPLRTFLNKLANSIPISSSPNPDIPTQ